MEAIEASIRAGVRPTTMILGEDNRKAWSRMDVLVMRAYERYKKEICPDCSNPLWLCRQSDPNLQVRMRPIDACYATAESKKHFERNKDDADAASAVPEFYARDGRPLVEYRASYFKHFEPAEGGD